MCTTTPASATRSRCWRVDVVALEMMVLRVLRPRRAGKQSAGRRGPAEDPRQRDPAALHRADDAGRRPLQRALHPEAMEAGWQGDPSRSARRTAPAGRHLLQLPQDDDLTADPTRSSATSSPKPCSGAEHGFRFHRRPGIALRDAVRRWVDKGFGFERRHAPKAGGGRRARSTANWPSWPDGAGDPGGHGGMGFGPIEAMVVNEELAAAW